MFEFNDEIKAQLRYFPQTLTRHRQADKTDRGKEDTKVRNDKETTKTEKKEGFKKLKIQALSFTKTADGRFMM